MTCCLSHTSVSRRGGGQCPRPRTFKRDLGFRGFLGGGVILSRVYLGVDFILPGVDLGVGFMLSQCGVYPVVKLCRC